MHLCRSAAALAVLAACEPTAPAAGTDGTGFEGGIPFGTYTVVGFGKEAGQNFALLAGLALLAPEGVPLVVGASRKAFLGSLSGRPPADRLPESLAACAVAVERLRGRNPLLLRVHDVEETLRFLAVVGRATSGS